jgi:hypothetical protein
MNNPRLLLVAATVSAFLIGAMVGAVVKAPEIVEVPVPVPSLVEVMVPSPYPSLVEVPVIPEACQVVIDALIDQNINALEFVVSVYNAYLDYPDEDILQFGRRVEAILTSDSIGPELPTDMSACDR